MLNLVFIIIAYLCGSINFAIVLSKLAGLPDPRGQGSGNPGATNVLRYGGKKLALLVIFGDALKGFIPVFIAKLLHIHGIALSGVALAAVLGHMFPVFFRFQGGKGVATTLGAILGLSWLLGLAVIGTWCFIALIFRFSSLASLIAVATLPLYCFLGGHKSYTLAMLVLTIIVFIRHRSNITRLCSGQEPKIGQSKKPS